MTESVTSESARPLPEGNPMGWVGHAPLPWIPGAVLSDCLYADGQPVLQALTDARLRDYLINARDPRTHEVVLARTHANLVLAGTAVNCYHRHVNLLERAQVLLLRVAQREGMAEAKFLADDIVTALCGGV